MALGWGKIVRSVALGILLLALFAMGRSKISLVYLHMNQGPSKTIVVSTGASWRIEGLLDAAALTQLNVNVPEQPEWSTGEVDTFRGLNDAKSARRVGPGQTKCWLGHIHALSHTIKNNWASVLILEDDADWDIAIKHQFAIVAPAIRAITNSTFHSSAQPYGNAWDLLWVGHYGDAIPSDAISLLDESLPETAKYRENDGRYITLTTERQRRMVHPTNGPLCTYAYALKAAAARKIFEYSKNGIQDIITTDLKRWCQAGFLRCVTINPELFHHHKKAGKITSEIAVAEGWEDLAAPWKVDFTANIRYSARCNSRSTELVTCSDEFGGS